MPPSSLPSGTPLANARGSEEPVPSHDREGLVVCDPVAALAARSAQVDSTVAAAAAALLAPAGEPGIAVLAVGGYGRRQLFPHSDVDLLLLAVSDRLMRERRADIAAFLQRLWDLGLRASHSVRVPEECTELHEDNIELNISLLDQRFIAGDEAIYGGMAAKLPRFLAANRDSLGHALARLTRERYARYAGSLHHLEPNVKETPGGLRDHQVVGWLAGLAGRAGEALAELDEPFRYLAGVRTVLHQQSGRDNNVLTFDAQDAIAEQRGDGAAAFMRGYYRQARRVHRAAVRALDGAESGSSGLLTRFRDWRGRLANAEFSVHAERAHFRVPGAIGVEPELVLRLFEFTARHGIPASPEAERQIAAHLPVLRERFGRPAPVPLWPALARILALPHATMALRGMHESGVLVAVFPELEAIDCLVIRDFYHRYTVDEHTLVGIEKLRALAAPDPFAGLAAETAEPELLMLALLFHDSGKGWPDAGHVDGSVRLADPAMRRIGVPPRGRDTVLFLIRRHLDLSAALQTRDTTDPATVRALAQEVETVERLKPLALLTWADISAVNPGAMTPWRSAQLWQLYLAVYNELTRNLAVDRIAPAPATEHRAAFLEGFPTRYLRTHTEEEIVEHIDLAERSRSRGVAVDVRRLEAAWRLTLAAADRPGLFATAAGVLAAFGMNILRAEAFSNSRGMVLDTFAFADPLRSLELNPTETGRLKSMAERAIAGKADVRELLRGRPKPVLPSRKARIPASVSFPPATEAATLIEIVAEDRPGLLYDLACVIREYGASIEVVLVDTEAHRAIDVFYVARDGRKLAPEDERALGEALRRAC